jgi:hypothetical protein
MKGGKSIHSVAMVLTIAVGAVLPVGSALKGKNSE